MVRINLTRVLALLPLVGNTFASPAGPDLSQRWINVKTIPDQPANGSTTINTISSSNGLDGPQISAVNATTWDWWYFDAVSPDLKTGVTIVFYTALSGGFPFLPPTLPVTLVSFVCTFPNGTSFSATIEASEATIVTVDNGSSGTFVGTGAGWVGREDLSEYTVAINSPENGLVGTFTLNSLAPAHYPCGKAQAGQNMLVGPHIGWSNAIPDAVGVVDFEILGSKYVWEGVAYHDKNWGNQPFEENVASWFWGHGRLGEYSLVWFDYLTPEGTEEVSAYASKNGKIISASCQPGSAKVRPTGANDAYPPIPSAGFPGGLEVTLDLGVEGTLSFTVTPVTVIQSLTTVYSRFAGSIEGSLNGGAVISGGVAMFEEFKLS